LPTRVPFTTNVFTIAVVGKKTRRDRREEDVPRRGKESELQGDAVAIEDERPKCMG
jgi:hypothetical protein